MKSLRILGLVGASLAIVGSFLPWEQEGDLFSNWTYGVQLFPRLRDYGGVLVVLLTMMIVLLILRPPRFIRNPGLWNVVISALLMAASILFLARWLVHRLESTGFIGAASLEIGLIGVVVGSALLLGAALVNYGRFKHRTKTAG